MPTWQFQNFKEPREENGPLLSGVVDHLSPHWICFLSWTQIRTLVVCGWRKIDRNIKSTLGHFIDFFFLCHSVHFCSCCNFWYVVWLTWAWAALTIWAHLASDLASSRELLTHSWIASCTFSGLLSEPCWMYKCFAASWTKSSSCGSEMGEGGG